MGYCIKLLQTNIFINKDSFEDLVTKVDNSEAYIKATHAIGPLGVDPTEEGVTELFLEAGFEPNFDGDGNIDNLTQVVNKLLHQQALLEEVAEFCRVGDFVEFSGEDTAHWRWYVDHDGVLQECMPEWDMDQDDRIVPFPVMKDVYREVRHLRDLAHHLYRSGGSMSTPVGNRGVKNEKMRLVWNPDTACYEDDEEYHKLKNLVLHIAKAIITYPSTHDKQIKKLVEELEGC